MGCCQRLSEFSLNLSFRRLLLLHWSLKASFLIMALFLYQTPIKISHSIELYLLIWILFIKYLVENKRFFFSLRSLILVINYIKQIIINSNYVLIFFPLNFLQDFIGINVQLVLFNWHRIHVKLICVLSFQCIRAIGLIQLVIAVLLFQIEWTNAHYHLEIAFIRVRTFLRLRICNLFLLVC